MDILSHPSPALASRSSEVDPLTDETLRPLAKRMARIMYDAPGIGLAAPQIGVMKRFIVFDLSEDGTGLMALCNPRIVERSGSCDLDDEGCLSLPGVSVPIERSCEVVCEAESLDGKTLRVTAEGLMARMLQHEIDHLDGKLIIDRASTENRKAALRRYRETSQLRSADGGL